jgi:uncharacterized membrane protein
MKNKIKTEILPIIFIIISIAASFYFYAHFPDRVPIHWNWQGEPDNWSGRGLAAFLFPLIILGLYLLFLFLPQIDPRRDRYQQFAKVYHRFKNVFVAFFTILYFTASLNGLGKNIRVEWVTPIIIGLLFIFIGNYLSKIKPNYFIGIRTPWTLASEEVWNKSHRFSGKIFALLGILMIISPLISRSFGPVIILVPLIAAIIIIFIHSYLTYLQVKKKPNP